MTAVRWERVGEVFHAALEVPAAEREAWLRERCAQEPEILLEVVSLLGSDASARDGFAAGIEPAIAALGVKPVLPPPTRAGPYRLVHEIGRGGMGTVYLAERDDDQYRSRVAIKLVARGMDTGMILARFYRERQTLARLEHPNIARLLDGGNTEDGRPYIVMEFIDGVRITDYCRSHALDTARRLTLFLDVLKAVDFAHRRFVVHRDLKPGNILVDKDGRVKLLDFGVCKLLHAQPLPGDETVEAGSTPLSPDYASPEQIRGEPVSIATDVYSAAAVLYEILTGAKAHRIEDYSLRGIERAICESEPVPPSVAAVDKTVARQLRGDLDNVLLLALRKEPERRYESIEKFAEDLRRHLAHLPVQARPDTFAYRAGKFLRRRHALVISAAAILAALSWGVWASSRSARIATENLGLVRKLSNTFVFDVYDAVRDLPGSTKARQLIVQTGLDYLDRLSANAGADLGLQLELASAYRRLGDVQGNVMSANFGETAAAGANYGKALALLDSVIRQDPSNRVALAEALTVHRRIGGILEYTRDTEKALASYRRAQGLAEELYKRSPDDEAGHRLAEIHLATAGPLGRSSNYRAAREEYVQAIEILNAIEVRGGRVQPSYLASAYAGRGVCDAHFGRLREALEGYRRAAAIREELAKNNPASVSNRRDLMLSYSHIGDVLGNPNRANLGDPAGAAQAYGKMLEIARAIHDADPADQRARSDYGIALSRVAVSLPVGREAERIRLLREALRFQEEVERRDARNVVNLGEMATGYLFLGDTYRVLRDDRSATGAYRDGLRRAESALSSGSAVTTYACLLFYGRLGESAARRGARAESLEYARRAAELADPAGPEAKSRAADRQVFLPARGAAAGGRIYAALWRFSGRGEDRARARELFSGSWNQYRALEGHAAFNAVYAREMREVEKALEELK
ncbi:MAG: protein kinase [Bryobacteraceae bacterium]|nr:protein kinase [Bryobacteraceae bacterium]